MVLGFTLLMLANLWYATIAKEVNARLPSHERVRVWGRDNSFPPFRLHGEMFPASPKRKQMWALVLVGAALLFGGFVFLTGTLLR